MSEKLKVSNETQSKEPKLNTKGKLGELLDKIKISRNLSEIKKNVLETTVFKAKDKDGKRIDRILVKDILKNPLNIVKGLALESLASFPVFAGIYKWMFLDKSKANYEFEKEEFSEMASDYYIESKKLNSEKLADKKVTEKEVNLIKEIADENGPEGVRLLDYYEKEKSISRNMKRVDFVELVRDLTWACKDYGMDPSIYIPYFLGVAKKESNFQKYAWNSFGATGIFQHMTHFIDERIPKIAAKLKGRNLAPSQEIMDRAIKQFSIKDGKVRKNRAEWPDGVKEFAFGNAAQAYMTVQLTNSNLKQVERLMGDRSKTTELYNLLYIAHNMGVSNLKKILKGEPLSDRWQKRFNMLQKTGVTSGVAKFAIRARNRLYGKSKEGMV